MLNIYADETCQNGHAFLVLGCTLVPTDAVNEAKRRIAELRDATGLGGELKWTKVSKAKLDDYKRFVDLYFSLNASSGLQFHALVAECAEIDHHRYSGGDGEIGFNKLIYQLLAKAADRRRTSAPFYAYLDQRTTRRGLDELQRILNATFARDFGAPQAFRRVHFLDSKSCELLQLNDVILGSIGCCRNGRLRSEDCSPAKRELAEHIRQHAGVRELGRDTPFSRNDFRVWNFRLQRK